MTDEKFEEFLQEAAQAYNRPPEPPREEMWSRIREAREVVPIEGAGRRRTARWVRWGTGIAAVLALGVALGRLTAPGPREVAIETDAPAAGVVPGAEGGGPTLPSAARDAQASRAVRLATTRHLNESEAFLTLFRAQASQGRVDNTTTMRAKQLLSSTRLRLDSRAAKDPQLRDLLQDLELVLAQIARLDATDGVTDAAEREFCDQGIEQKQLLPRLRTTLAERPLART